MARKSPSGRMARKSFLTMEALPLEELQNLRAYDPHDPSTYTSVRPQFLRYQKNRKAYDEDLFENCRKADDEDFFENSEGIEQIQRSPCSKIKFLILFVALFVFIVCVSPAHSSKLYGDPNLQSLNEYEYADGFGLPIGESLEEMYPPINEYADELGLLINEDTEESGFRNNEIDGDEAHELAVLKQFDTLKFESTHNFGAYNTILIGQFRKLALKSPNHMEAVILEENKLALKSPNHMETVMLEANKAGKCVIYVFVVEDSKHLGVTNVLVAKDSKHLGLLDVLIAKDSKHLGVLDVIAAKDSKHLGEADVLVAKDSKHLGASTTTAIKSIVIPMLCAVTGVFFCAAAVVINWYKRKAIHDSRKTSLEFVKGIRAKNKNPTQQGPLKQLSKMQTKGSPVPTVQLLNEYSTENAISSFDKKKDNIWNDTSAGGNSFYISNPTDRRKDNSGRTTYQENMITGVIPMKTTPYGSLTTMAKKDKNKKQQKLTPVRRSDRIRTATKSNSSLYKQDVDTQHLKAIPLRRSERIGNSKKSDCARRQHA